MHGQILITYHLFVESYIRPDLIYAMEAKVGANVVRSSGDCSKLSL